jgi:dihydropteroate synthase
MATALHGDPLFDTGLLSERTGPRLAPLVAGGRTFEWGSRTYVMGVLNLTPDSFSGDGVGYDVEAAVAQGLRFEEEGADIVDVGGESTRPASVYAGAAPVTAEEELRRVMPVLERLVARLKVPVSIDTRKARVA